MSLLSDRYAYLKPYDAQLENRISAFRNEEAALPDLKSTIKPVTLSYDWTDSDFSPALPPITYEVWPDAQASWGWICDNILPTMTKGGYNTLQLMARPALDRIPRPLPVTAFGTPEELCRLVDTAHSMGIRVLLDASCRMIGTPSPAVREEVLAFLVHTLSTYHVDGFRFCSISYLLYKDHAEGTVFNSLDQYFGDNTDPEAILLLQMTNHVIHTIRPDAITVAEDVSGMPGMAESIDEGGLGFDFRMAMGVPTMWQKLAGMRDEDWLMQDIWQELCRRNGPSIATVEDHVQVFNGCETIMNRLAGDVLKTNARLARHHSGLDRGIALHKLIRLATCAAAGEGIQTTLGTEGGCPGWPSAIEVATLIADPECIYSRLATYDRDVVSLLKEHHVLSDPEMPLRRLHNDDHVLAFERGGLLFVFNFHPFSSYDGYGIPVETECDYRVIFSSDDSKYNGFDMIEHMSHSVYRKQVRLYLPARTALVLAKVQD